MKWGIKIIVENPDAPQTGRICVSLHQEGKIPMTIDISFNDLPWFNALKNIGYQCPAFKELDVNGLIE